MTRDEVLDAALAKASTVEGGLVKETVIVRVSMGRAYNNDYFDAVERCGETPESRIDLIAKDVVDVYRKR